MSESDLKIGACILFIFLKFNFSKFNLLHFDTSINLR